MSGTTADLHVLPAPKPRKREPVLSSPVLATLLFVGAEVMLFAGFISAFAVAKTGAPGSVWPPPGQPRLPVASTAVNTAMLIASGVLLYVAWRRFKQEPKQAQLPFLGSLVLGALFVGLQGVEWAGLISEGLTLASSQLGSFFYMIVGAHALHAVVALGVMGWMYVRLLRGRLSADAFSATAAFWYFVVGVWPVLYWQVYLG